MFKPRFLALASMIVLAAATRLIPHPPNMTPIAAIALFGGATFADRRLAFLMPLAALALSDLVIGFSRDSGFVYLSFALIVATGMWLQQRRTAPVILGAVLFSSCLFFALTNFGVWALGAMYPHTLAGLGACYVAAIPFFRNEALGDLFYAALLFGGFALLERAWPALRTRASSFV